MGILLVRVRVIGNITTGRTPAVGQALAADGLAAVGAVVETARADGPVTVGTGLPTAGTAGGFARFAVLGAVQAQVGVAALTGRGPVLGGVAAAIAAAHAPPAAERDIGAA